MKIYTHCLMDSQVIIKIWDRHYSTILGKVLLSRQFVFMSFMMTLFFVFFSHQNLYLYMCESIFLVTDNVGKNMQYACLIQGNLLMRLMKTIDDVKPLIAFIT